MKMKIFSLNFNKNWYYMYNGIKMPITSSRYIVNVMLDCLVWYWYNILNCSHRVLVRTVTVKYLVRNSEIFIKNESQDPEQSGLWAEDLHSPLPTFRAIARRCFYHLRCEAVADNKLSHLVSHLVRLHHCWRSAMSHSPKLDFLFSSQWI